MTHPVLPPASQRAGHGWEPASACTPGCLPPPGSLPTLGRARVAARLVGLAAVLAGATLVAALLPLLGPMLGRYRRTALLRGLFRALLRAAGARLAHCGAPRFDTGDETGVLVVANHLSWLDILALGAVQPMRMVAKREIRGWPLLGALAERIGTLFVDRSGLRSLPDLVARTADVLRSGTVVGLFPEGTTWCGAASGEFRRAGFQAALDACVPVRPVAQRLLLPDGSPTAVGAFIGEDTLWNSMLRVLRLPGLVVEVSVLPLLVAGPGVDRRDLARRAELAIVAATGVPGPASARPAPARPAGSEPVPLAA